ncbi:MAG: bifunctional DNA primase/polymerase [Pirellula sp.]|jgi:putative DNA primase/helicase|nr:bifunctional DNA primase/polymerase [Pirellula sp.]
MITELVNQVTETPLFLLACRYVDAGYSVVPLRLDGTKSPAISSWKEYQTRLPTINELGTWFEIPRGIGILTGSISGGLEAIDYDMAVLKDPHLSLLPSDLVARLAVYQTPSGWHVMYRCDEVCGNRKLAMWEAPASVSQKDKGYRDGTELQSIGKGVRIETRGEGGYVVGAGSPLHVHPSKRPYRHHSGPTLFELGKITPEERKLIWQAAMSFDCGIDHEAEARKRGLAKARRLHYGTQKTDTSTPWDWYDRFGSWDDVLTGWVRVSESKFRRPGKTHGISASLVEVDGVELCTIFSTSVDVPSGSYGKFNLLAKLRFNGDRREACKHVRQLMAGRAVA